MKRLTTLLAFFALISWPILGQNCSCTSPEIAYYLDLDGDGFGAGECICSDTSPGVGYVTTGTDLCPNDYLHTTTQGLCGCGKDDSRDTDQDGTVDCLDDCPYNSDIVTSPDTDGDGVNDCMDQCPGNISIYVSSTVCGCIGDADGNGTIDALDCPITSAGGCMDIFACNFDNSATLNNGSCSYPTSCRTCYDELTTTTYTPNTASAVQDGTGVVYQNYQGAPCGCGSGSTVLTEDAIGICGGSCATDADEDGICDDVDPCQQILTSNGLPCNATDPLCPRLNSCGICEVPLAGQSFSLYRNLVLYQTTLGVPCDPDWRDNGETCVPGEIGCLNVSSDCNQVITYQTIDSVPCPNAQTAGCYAQYTACNDTSATGCYFGTSGCRISIYLDSSSEPCHPDSTDCVEHVQNDCFNTSIECSPGSTGCQTSQGICNCTTILEENLDGLTTAVSVSPQTLSRCLVCNVDDPAIGYGCDYTCLDVDSDGWCDADETIGCGDPTKCNYSANYQEFNNSLCTVNDICGICDGTTQFTDSLGNVCTPISWNRLDGTVCTQGDDFCYPQFGSCARADGACDCQGNFPPAGYNCGGNCILDVDGDGVCDPEEIDGCMDATACNYDAAATDDDSSCLSNDALGICGGDCYADNDGDGTCDRLNDGTIVDACVGQLDDCGICNGSSTFKRSGVICTPGTFVNAMGAACIPGSTGCLPCAMSVTLVSGALIAPDYRTAGNERCHPDSSGCTDANTYTAPIVVAEACNCNGDIYDAVGSCGGYCAEDADFDGLCDVTFDGQIIDPDPTSTCSGTFDQVGVCDGTCILDFDKDGLCDEHADGSVDDPCLDLASNYQDECGICDGTGIPEGKCNCAGTLEDDALGNCGGDCVEDWDRDGICDLTESGDKPDPCSGIRDFCGICNGESEYLRNGQECIPGTFGTIDGVPCVPGEAGCFGCMLTLHMAGDSVCPPVYVTTAGALCHPGDYDCSATYPGCTAVQSCDCWGNEFDVYGNCDGGCLADADNDGICDETSDGLFLDLCVDEDGVDAIGVCGGSCLTDDDGDGICDDGGNDPCVGILDECLICNGEGRLFARHCDGSCYNDADNDNVCDELEQIAISEGMTYVDLGGAGEFSLDPVAHQLALTQFTQLHLSMVDSLNGGSLNGVTYNVELDKSLKSRGFLDVRGLTNFGSNIRVSGNLLVDGILNVTGNATIGGVTYSQNGLHSDRIDNLGQFATDGNIRFGDGMAVYGTASLRNMTGFEGQMSLFESSSVLGQVSNNLLFNVVPESGATTMSGRLISTGPLTTHESITFQNGLTTSGLASLEDLRVGEITVDSLVTIGGDLRIQNNNVAVDAANGDVDMQGTLIVAGDMFANTLKGMNSLDVLGTTIARTGVETPSMIARGNLTVGGRSDFTRNLYVNGVGQFKNALDAVAPLKIYASNTAEKTYTDNSGTLCIPDTLDSEGNPCTLPSAGCQVEYPAGCKVASFGNDIIAPVISVDNTGDLVTTGDLIASGSVHVDNAVFEQNLTINGSRILTAESSTLIAGSLRTDKGIEFGSSVIFEDGLLSRDLTLGGNISSTGGGNSTLKRLKGSGELALSDAKFYGTSTVNYAALDVTTTQKDFVGIIRNTPSSSATSQSNNQSATENIGGILMKFKESPGNNAAPFGSVAKLNRFITFKNSNDVIVGRINMESESDRLSNPYYQVQAKHTGMAQASATWGVVNSSLDMGIALGDLIVAVSTLVGASASTTPCFGNGACATIPLISLIIQSAIAIVPAGINVWQGGFSVGGAAAGLAWANKDKDFLEYTNFVGVPASVSGANYDGINHALKPIVQVGSTKYGVSYESGGADYAEWLPKQNQSIKLAAGMVVGLHPDGLSLSTENSIQNFVVSKQPVILGNAPGKFAEKNYEKIALMGQVQTYVAGPVHSGDYIIPSGTNQGICKAINPLETTRMTLREVVGVAWETNVDFDVKLVNVAIGVNQAGLNNGFEKLEKDTENMRQQTAALKKVLLAIAKDEKPSNQDLRSALLVPSEIIFSAPTKEELVQSSYAPNGDDEESLYLESDAVQEKYIELNHEIVSSQLDLAIDWMRATEFRAVDEASLELLESNQAFRDFFVDIITTTGNNVQLAQAQKFQELYGNEPPSVRSLPLKRVQLNNWNK